MLGQYPINLQTLYSLNLLPAKIRLVQLQLEYKDQLRKLKQVDGSLLTVQVDSCLDGWQTSKRLPLPSIIL